MTPDEVKQAEALVESAVTADVEQGKVELQFGPASSEAIPTLPKLSCFRVIYATVQAGKDLPFQPGSGGRSSTDRQRFVVAVDEQAAGEAVMKSHPGLEVHVQQVGPYAKDVLLVLP